MKKYKVLSHKQTNGNLCVALRGNKGIRYVYIPTEYQPFIRSGISFRIHNDALRRPVAYSFGNQMYFLMRPMTNEAIQKFVNNFQDLYDLSLDSLRFKYALGRAVHGVGGIVHGVVNNMEKYNAMYCTKNRTR